MKKKLKYNIAIMGATGVVGREMMRILEQRRFPIASIRFLASFRSAGNKLIFGGQKHTVELLDENSFDGVDIVLASAGSSFSKRFTELLQLRRAKGSGWD